MRRPLVWGSLFLVAGMLFLGLAYSPSTSGEASLASQAGGSSGSTSGPAASGAQMGLSVVSTLTGLVLVGVSLACFGSKVTDRVKP